MNEALRDKLQHIVGLSAGWDGEGSLGPREPHSWETVARMAMDLARAGLNDLAAQSEQSAAPVPEPWQHESLAMFIAEYEGNDPHQLIWKGNPPEPWGEIWNRYEVEARAIIAFLRDTPAAPRDPVMAEVSRIRDAVSAFGDSQP